MPFALAPWRCSLKTGAEGGLVGHHKCAALLILLWCRAGRNTAHSNDCQDDTGQSCSLHVFWKQIIVQRALHAWNQTPSTGGRKIGAARKLSKSVGNSFWHFSMILTFFALREKWHWAELAFIVQCAPQSRDCLRLRRRLSPLPPPQIARVLIGRTPRGLCNNAAF